MDAVEINWGKVVEQLFGKPEFKVSGRRVEEVEEYDDNEYYTAEYEYIDLQMRVNDEFITIAEDMQVDNDSYIEVIDDSFDALVRPLAENSELALTFAADPDAFVYNVYVALVNQGWDFVNNKK